VKRRKQRKINLTSFLIILLIIALLIAAHNITGNLVIIAKNQKHLDDRYNKIELQLEGMQAQYEANTAEQSQRISTLEARPTYKPVEEKPKQEPKAEVEPQKEKHKDTSFDIPTVDPLIPLAEVLTLLGGLTKILKPIGGF
jgi:outer membrane biosynthesis protein TonB